MQIELRTLLTERLGSRYPIIQSPMTWVSDARLAGDVSSAGGFGIFASTTVRAGEVDAEIVRIRQSTSAPFGVYATGLQPNLDEVVDAVIRHNVRGFCYGRGVTSATLERLKSHGVVCMTNVGAVRHAVKAVEVGADILLVQGGEGGGHTGAASTMVLLPQVLDAVDVPVVAAGGFRDGRGLAAALACGAVGVAMGTRFMMTTNTRVAAPTLAHYANVTDPARITVSTAIDGLPQRVIANRLVSAMEQNTAALQMIPALRAAWNFRTQQKLSFLQFLAMSLKSLREGPVAASQALRMARLPELLRLGLEQGDVEHGLLPAGQAAAAITEIVSCEQVIREIVQVASQRLKSIDKEIALV
ncbi:MAG TPA: nitronate monooxygenase [Pararhizobium sp.]|uniref:NAD(P)H-dependent flavin oxidoreductase n=1 Tax=Pararhizobium sp. TaxID=1977563 RepID=UPI002BBB0889|nr:nitronate monooxygenase [Pararhizobium sp.]HTO34153.1 nitronate monooxygenase [Pararhizobium sp.]